MPWSSIASPGPGRLGRSAYHFIHPIMVAGIIVTAAADEIVLADPSRSGVTSTAWMVLGGTALFLAGHALFKASVWRVAPWTRIAAIVALGALLPFGSHLPALGLALAALAVVLAVTLSDRVRLPAQPT